MELWLQIVLTICTSVLASSGLWAFISSRMDRNTAEREMLVGIAHIEILFFGLQYIDRGWITKDEYETLDSLYKPYLKLGGNGSATKVMREIEKLPIHKTNLGG